MVTKELNFVKHFVFTNNSEINASQVIPHLFGMYSTMYAVIFLGRHNILGFQHICLKFRPPNEGTSPRLLVLVTQLNIVYSNSNCMFETELLWH